MDQPRGPPNRGLGTKGSVFGRAEKPQQQLPPFVLPGFKISSVSAKRAKISIFHPKTGPGSPFACRLAADGLKTPWQGTPEARSGAFGAFSLLLWVCGSPSAGSRSTPQIRRRRPEQRGSTAV